MTILKINIEVASVHNLISIKVAILEVVTLFIFILVKC